MKEPLWKTFLNWGAIVLFMLVPVAFATIHIYELTHPGWVGRDKEDGEFKYLLEFERNLGILVFGLAGMHTWENIKNGKNNHERTTDNR